jgi:hypothetical protein
MSPVRSEKFVLNVDASLVGWFVEAELTAVRGIKRSEDLSTCWLLRW